MINTLKRSNFSFKLSIGFLLYFPTVLCDVLSDLTARGVVIPMFEQNEDVVI